MPNKDYGEQHFNEKIRNKYLFWVSMITITIFIIFGSLIFSHTYDLFMQEVSENSNAKVELAASKIDDWLEAKLAFLQIIGDTVSENNNTKISENLVNEAIKKYKALSIYMGFTNGRLIDGGGWVPPDNYDPRQKAWYLQAVLNKAPAFTSTYEDIVNKEKVITISYPVYDSGGLIGVVAMDITISQINNHLTHLKSGKQNKVFLVSNTGAFIAHDEKGRVTKVNIKETPDKNIFLQAISSTENLNTYENEDYIVVAKIPLSQWYLIYHLSHAEVFRPLHKLIAIFIAGLIVSLLALGFALVIISGRFAKPIKYLVGGAKKIKEGNYNQHMPIERRDELGYLTYSFNEMAKGLKEREFIRGTFGKYVPQEIVTELLRGNSQLVSVKKDITFLFCDIRDFTQLSENKDPALVLVYLNSFFTRMEQVVSQHGGHINKYLGDGFLAIFGAPAPLDNSAQQAVDAAHHMLDQLDKFNQEHMSHTKIGIGIHSGEALIGNIGSENRTEYSAIGDSVNLTSRIESLCKHYGENLLVSEQVISKLGPEFGYRMIDKTLVKGRQAPVVIYRTHPLSTLTESQRTELENANQAVQAYLDGNFETALTLIKKYFPKPPHYLNLIIKEISD